MWVNSREGPPSLCLVGRGIGYGPLSLSLLCRFQHPFWAWGFRGVLEGTQAQNRQGLATQGVCGRDGES